MRDSITYIAIVAAASFAFWGWSKSLELKELRAAALEEQSKAVIEAFKTESELQHQAAQIQSETHDQVFAIEFAAADYLSKLNSLQYNSTPDSPQVPFLATTSAGAQSDQSSESFGASLRVCKTNLEQAKRRILYEAKEYDILAAHYNALLKLYSTSKETLDHAQKENSSD